MLDFYENIVRAQTLVSDAAISIQSTFAPLPKDDPMKKLIWDFIGLSYALVAAPVWNIG